MKKILVYSILGSSNMDHRITSISIFLKEKGYHVVAMDNGKYIIGNNEIYKKYRIRTYYPQFIEERKIVFKVIREVLKCFSKNLGNKIYNKLTSHYRKKRENVIPNYHLHLISKINPDVIIAPDLSHDLPEKYNIMNDLHEVMYYINSEVDLEVKKAQEKDLERAKGIICVTPQIAHKFYNKFYEEGKVIVIPNAPLL